MLLGVDIGTGSTKGVLARPDGQIVATASRTHRMSLPRPGWAEMDAEAIWWGDVAAICRELLPKAAGATLAGVCVSGLGPCLVVTDENTQPLRDAILYGIDMRATAEIEELTERLGAERILERCGKALSTQAVGPKLLWLRRREPELWQRVRRWYSANGFVVAKLTGEHVIDHHTASQCDPLYDLTRNDWATDFAEEVSPGLALPRLAWPSELVGTVTAGAAEQTGLPEGTPVAAGTVDAWAEAFSAGVRAPGDLMLMYGSTMFFVQVLDRLTAHPGLWTTAGVEEGTTTLAAGMATSGSLTSWLQELVGGVPFEQLVQEAAATPPGSDGVVLLPYFAGERTPIFDPRARGVVAGLTLRHHRGHLFRAVYEGIAFGIRQILEFLDGAAGPAQRIVAVGGGTQGGLWTQIVTDVCGREQQLPAQTIGASYGDALLAAIGTGLVPPSTDWSRVSGRVEPDRGNAGLYDELYRTYRELYPATTEQVHRLAEMQGRSFEAPAPERGSRPSGPRVGPGLTPRPGPDPLADLELAVRCARDAGRLLMARFGGPAAGVDLKSSSTDMVSDADREAERSIVALLHAERPDDGILAEEGASATAASGRRWVIDPLDGTTNFLYGLPVWAVSIALEDDDGALVGVVFDPNRDELFAAARGGGMTVNGEPVRVRPGTQLERALFATGFGYDAAERARQARVVADLLPRVRDIRRAGAAALDLAWLAAGRLDGYWERGVKRWDWAAGRLLVTEAGGQVRDIDGDPHGLVAATPQLVDELERLVTPS